MTSNEIYIPSTENEEKKIRLTPKGKKAIATAAIAATILGGGAGFAKAAEFNPIDSITVQTGINSNGEIAQLEYALESNGYNSDEIGDVAYAGQEIASLDTNSVEVDISENAFGQQRVEVSTPDNE